MKHPWIRFPRLLRRVAFSGVLGVGIAYGGLVLSRSPEAPSPYEVGTVSRGSMSQWVTAPGKLDLQVKSEVGSSISGMVKAVLVEVGDRVRAGQPLVRLDAASYEAIVREARVNLQNARNAVIAVRKQARQMRALQSEGLVSGSDLDKTLAQLQQAEGSVKSQRAEVDKLTIDVDRCTIRAPIDGVVVALDIEVGKVVATGVSAPPLLVIAGDPSALQIEASVAEADVGRVAQGQKAEFTLDAFPGERFEGRVSEVQTTPVVDQNVVTYPAVVLPGSPKPGFRPGMTATVSLLVAERDDVLRIPNAALRFRPPSEGPGRHVSAKSAGGAGVYRLPRPGEGAGDASAPGLVRVAIQTGLDDGRYTETVGGLKEGDRVVVGVRASAPEKGLLARISSLIGGGAKEKGH